MFKKPTAIKRPMAITSIKDSNTGINLKSIIVRDALTQIDHLLNKKAIEIGQAPDGLVLQADININGIIPLAKTDILHNLRLLQDWLQKFAQPSDLPMICQILLKVAANSGVGRMFKFKAKSKEKASVPSSQDKKTTIHDLTDDERVIYYVLETLHRVFIAIIDLSVIKEEQHDGITGILNTEEDLVNDSERYQRLTNVPSSALQFCYQYLHHSFPDTIRHMSAECLGVLSNSHTLLRQITSEFIRILGTVKKSDQYRSYTTYQHAVAEFHFDVSQFKDLEYL